MQKKTKKTIKDPLKSQIETNSNDIPNVNQGVKTCTATSNRRILLNLIRKLNNFKYVPPEAVPDIDLYMEQLTSLIDSHVERSKKDEEKALTKTMINNYTKSKLLPPSNKKKYSKDHVILLSFIYYFKNIISLSEAKVLFAPLTEKYFENKDEKLKLKDIYEEILNLQKGDFRDLQRDLFRKLKKADASFKDSEESDREYLSLFSFVCELAFDVYVKKYIIEQICELLED